MKRLVMLVGLMGLMYSCNVTESVVFNQDGSGTFNTTYDLGTAMAQMKSMGATGGDEDTEKKVVDTVMVFSELLKTHKDSIAQLSEDRQLAFEAIQDMFMTMKMDEEKGLFEFGVGMEFESIDDLKGIGEKIAAAKRINSKGEELDVMKDSSPIGKYMDNDNLNVGYDLTATGFSRTTDMTEQEITETKELFDELAKLEDEESREMQQDMFTGYFESSTYTVSLTFPKKIKSTSIEGATISEDGKTLSYDASWLDYLKDPKMLDVKVEFLDE